MCNNLWSVSLILLWSCVLLISYKGTTNSAKIYFFEDYALSFFFIICKRIACLVLFVYSSSFYTSHVKSCQVMTSQVKSRRNRIGEWWEVSPHTNGSSDWFPDYTSHVGQICWFSTPLQGVFLFLLLLLLLLLIIIIINMIIMLPCVSCYPSNPKLVQFFLPVTCDLWPVTCKKTCRYKSISVLPVLSQCLCQQ